MRCILLPTDVKLQKSVRTKKLSSGNLQQRSWTSGDGMPSGFQEDKNADYFRIQVVCNQSGTKDSPILNCGEADQIFSLVQALSNLSSNRNSLRL